MFKTLDDVRLLLRSHRMSGRFIVCLELAADTSRITVKKTLGPGHYTMWGDPTFIRRMVIAVYPVDSLPENSR